MEHEDEKSETAKETESKSLQGKGSKTALVAGETEADSVSTSTEAKQSQKNIT